VNVDIPSDETGREYAIAELSVQLRALRDAGRPEEALGRLAAWDQALRRTAPDDRFAELELMILGAGYLMETADVQAADRSIEFALAHAHALKDAVVSGELSDEDGKRLRRVHRALASTCTLLGGQLHGVGDFHSARVMFEEALEFAERPAQDDLRVQVLMNLAGVAAAQDDVEKARTAAQEAVALAVATPGVRGTLLMVRTLTRAADILFDEERGAEAVAHLRLVLELALDLAEAESPVVCEVQSALAWYLWREGQTAEAELHARQAAGGLQRTLGHTHPAWATTAALLVQILWDVGRIEGISELLAALSMTNDWVLRHQLAIGSETTRLNHLSVSEPTIDRWLSLATDLGPVEPRLARVALDIVLRRKGLLAEILAAQRVALRGEHADAELVAQLAATRDALSHAILDESASDDDVDELRQRAAGLETLVHLLERVGADALVPPGAPLEERHLHHVEELAPWLQPSAEVATALPILSALIEIVAFVQTAPRYWTTSPVRAYAALVWPQGRGEPMILDLGSAQEIDDAAGAFVRAIDEEGARLAAGETVAPYGEAVLRTGTRLRELAVDPVLRALRNFRVEGLLIAGDGALAQAPLHALPLDGGTLLDRFEVVSLTSGRDLSRPVVVHPRGPPCVAADADYDAFGDPAKAVEGFDRLTGTAEEGRAVAELLGVTPLMGAKVTEAALRGVASPALLHVATHGWFLAEAGAADEPPWSSHPRLARVREDTLESYQARSGLVLAGFNTVWNGGRVPDEMGDGLLTAGEIADLSLHGTELVVLSACDTGLGHVRSLEGALGLRRAVTIAGARSLVVALWQVPDAPTRRIMEGFYKRLLQGAGRARALREAQLEERDRNPHPFVWAGFVCHGDGAPLPADLITELGGDPRAAVSPFERAVFAAADDDQLRVVYEVACGGDLEAIATLAGALVHGGRAEEAVPWLEIAAEAGDYGSAGLLADTLLALGRPEESVAWRQRAAEAGNGRAGFELGSMAFEAADTDEAIRWFEVGARAGDLDAAFNLGLLTHDRSPAEAEQWWRHAAERGMPQAGNSLGKALHERGDLAGARRFFRFAADAAHVSAAGALGSVFRSGRACRSRAVVSSRRPARQQRGDARGGPHAGEPRRGRRRTALALAGRRRWG
jgi:CHAT domain-containing protein/TPR repeat protein